MGTGGVEVEGRRVVFRWGSSIREMSRLLLELIDAPGRRVDGVVARCWGDETRIAV